MPGQMGNHKRTILNLPVFKVDPYLNIVFVKGAVPGPKNGWVHIYDTPGQKYVSETPPFPTYKPFAGEMVPFELRLMREDLDDKFRYAHVSTDVNHMIVQRMKKLGPSKGQLDLHSRPQNMADLVKAAIQKRQTEKDNIVAKQNLEKARLKKVIKATKKKAVDIDDD